MRRNVVAVRRTLLCDRGHGSRPPEGASTAPGAFAPVFPLLAEDVVFLVLGQVSPTVALMLEMFVHASVKKRFPSLALPITVVVVVAVPLDEAETRFGGRSGVRRRGEQHRGRYERGSEHQYSHSWLP
jgi:hypothetical protein